ncbi:MAG: pyridoxamine 5'-phosphate oxidase family protein [Ktedonobacteraceae bacterium]
MNVNIHIPLPPGRQQARTRWQTHESGAIFDRKKTPYLTEQAQAFIAQQSFCVVAGLGPQADLCGLLLSGNPGFVQTPDGFTCSIQLSNQPSTSRLIQGLHHYATNGEGVPLGLFFICHPTRERLCVQGLAHVQPSDEAFLSHPSVSSQATQVCLDIREVFFHCAKYIKTKVAGLTSPITSTPPFGWYPQALLGYNQKHLSVEVQAFIEQQVLCFLCTRGEDGQCAINHRGGVPKFLVTLPPTPEFPGGRLLLPDYAGNGAFEAIGNILETGQAALVIPNYAAQLAILVSGTAQIAELEELPLELAQRCTGAERVVVVDIQHVETQHGDWSAALAYERSRAESFWAKGSRANSCPL